MKYVRCIRNKPYIRHQGEPFQEEELASLTVGRIYKALPPTEDEMRLDELRVIDNEGEDYLYPADYFKRIEFGPVRKPIDTATIHLDPLTKDILRAEAVADKKLVAEIA